MEQKRIDLIYLLKRLNDALKQNADKEFSKLGLTMSQADTLIFLGEAEGHHSTQKKMETAFQISHPAINGILRRLEEKGIVRTQISTSGRMTKDVWLDARGEELFETISREKQENTNWVQRFLSEEDERLFAELIAKLEKGVKES